LLTGEQLSAAVAWALATNGQMPMLDEPTSVLDPETAGKAMAAVRYSAE
jgi:ABC-type histidine transport system ATPase subunit